MSEIAIISYGAANSGGANIPSRLRKKIDEFSALALHVCQEILTAPEAALSMEELENTGIFVGNVYGGWSYALPYMEQLYKDKEVNYQALSPYIATSWFPTAAQGELSIMFQMLGSSKTFSAGNLSSGYSITYGVDEIKENEGELALVGGSEVLPIELSEKYHVRIQKDAVSSTAFLLLQDAEKALHKGRKILCYIKGYAYGSSFVETMELVLSETANNKIEAVISSETDTEELAAIKSVFLLDKEIKVYDVSSEYGKLHGSQVAVQIVSAIKLMRQMTSVCSSNNQFMVNAKDSNGIYLSILLALNS